MPMSGFTSDATVANTILQTTKVLWANRKSDMEPFVNSLKKNKISSPRVIVYCQSLNFCSDLICTFLI